MRFFVLGCLALVLASNAQAAASDVKRHTCANGLEVWVVEDHSEPLVTVEIAAHNGSMTESPEYNGLSHLYEHMFFKANAVLPSQEAYLARLKALGIVFNGTTGTERVNYFFTTTSDQLNGAMVFMRDAIVTPLFDEKELAKERVVVTGEIDRNESSPFYYLYHAADQALFWKYPSYKDPLGNRATVLAATVAQMRTIQERYYVPNNSVLVVTGDVSAADIFAQADALYAGWKRAADPFKAHPLMKHPPLPKSALVYVEQAVHTVVGSMMWQGPSVVGSQIPATYAADLVGTALQQPGSRFQHALVDSGACVRASLNWETQRNVGPITLSFEATPDKIDACVSAMRAELPQIRSPDYFSDSELKDAAFRLEVGQSEEAERSSELANTLTFVWASAGLDYYLGYAAKTRAVTRKDIAKYLDTYVLGHPFVFAVMVAKDMNLPRAHFEALLAQKGGAK